MKELEKNLEATGGVPAEAELAAINRFAKSPLRAEEVYTFSLRLCDNEVDRDWERFDTAALNTLGDLFVGKSGIFDHQWTAEGQTARIYRTEMVREGAQVTAVGDGYCWLKAWAYLLRTEKNADLIAEIEGGIKREVSVGCSVARRVCSICGAEGGTCQHTPGQRYGEQLCYLELRDPTDAYEWSFVAVPAQRKAGVLKRYGHENQGMAQLRAQAELGRKYLRELRREVTRLAMLADDSMDGFACDDLAEGELVKVSANGTVAACAAGDDFCGMVLSVGRGGDACAVALGGMVTAGYTVPAEGAAPALGWSGLSADGEGGVQADADGSTYLVVDVDTTAKTVTFVL
mgnify:CR=1 FL=1